MSTVHYHFSFYSIACKDDEFWLWLGETNAEWSSLSPLWRACEPRLIICPCRGNKWKLDPPIQLWQEMYVLWKWVYDFRICTDGFVLSKQRPQNWTEYSWESISHEAQLFAYIFVSTEMMEGKTKKQFLLSSGTIFPSIVYYWWNIFKTIFFFKVQYTKCNAYDEIWMYTKILQNRYILLANTSMCH